MREKWVPHRLEVGQEGVAAEEPLKGRQDAGQGRSVLGIWKLRCCQMPRWAWGAGHTLKKSLELGTPPHPGGWSGQGGRKPGEGGQTEASGATASKKRKWSAQLVSGSPAGIIQGEAGGVLPLSGCTTPTPTSRHSEWAFLLCCP